MSAIARVYASRCEAGARNFNTVPDKLKEEVRGYIEEDGFYIDEDGWCHPKGHSTNDAEEEETE